MGDIPLVDLTEMIEDVGEEGVAYEILAAYLDETVERISKLKAAIEGEDFEIAVRQAHSIKGGALNFNCHMLAEPAMRLEKMAKNQAFNEPEPLVRTIEDGYGRVRDFLNSKLEG